MVQCITAIVARDMRTYESLIPSVLAAPDAYLLYDPDRSSPLPALLAASDLPPMAWVDAGPGPGLPQATPPEAAPDHVVLALSGGEWRPPAAYFAAAHGGALADGAGDPSAALAEVLTRSSPRWLTLVGDPQRFDDRLLLRLMEVQTLSPGPLVGILTQRSPSRLSELVFKNLLYRNHPAPGGCLVAAGVVEAPLEVGRDGVRVLSKPLATADELCRTRPRPLKLFAIVAHGRPDTVNLADAKICGRTRRRDPGQVESSGFHGCPACHYTGECHRPSVLVAGDEVPAAAVLVNSCFSLGLSACLFDLRYSLALAVLDGVAAAFLASPLMREARCLETALIAGAIRDGCSLGEAARLGAHILSDTRLDHPSLLLVGDPTLRPYLRGGGPVECQARKIAADEHLVAGPARTSSLLWVRFDPVDVPARMNQGLTCVVPARTPADRLPLFWAGLEAAHGGQLIVGSWAEVDWSSLEFRVFGRPEPFTDFIRRMAATSMALGFNSLIGINPPNAPGRLKQAAEIQAHIAALHGESQFDLRGQELIPNRETQLAELLKSLERDTLDLLLDRTDRRVFHFSDVYRHFCSLSHVAPAGPCPQCGGAALYFHLCHLSNTDFRRRWLMCVRCGVMEDVPDPCDGSPDLVLELAGPAELLGHQPWNGVLTILNRSLPASAPIQAGVRVVGGSWFHAAYEPDRVSVRLEPGARAQVPVRVIPGDPPAPHQYWFRAYALARGAIYHINRDVFFVPPEVEPRGPA